MPAGSRQTGVDMKVLNIIGAVAGAIFRLVAAIAVVYLIYQGAGICYDYGYRIFTESAVSTGEGRTVTVTVTESMSPMEIGELFEKRGLVRDAKLFTLQYYLSEYFKDVGPGTFELNTAMTAEEMMAAMVVEKEDTEDSEDSEDSDSSDGTGTAGQGDDAEDPIEPEDTQESGPEGAEG
ncbi:MAG: endolytic transglycosylase MltG [Lachnospiraceae bacterium]|jgi:UPF0755 protein|nr:endolytic transglycosylase MltG [Lachnospiraceae bacterium]